MSRRGPSCPPSAAEDRLHDLLSTCKQWKQATESRLRLVSNREMSDVLLPPDAALFDAIDKADGETHHGPDFPEGVEAGPQIQNLSDSSPTQKRISLANRGVKG